MGKCINVLHCHPNLIMNDVSERCTGETRGAWPWWCVTCGPRSPSQRRTSTWSSVSSARAGSPPCCHKGMEKRLGSNIKKNIYIWRMLSRCSRSYEKVGDLADLKSRFESLSLSNDITQLLALDSFIHRLMGEWETIRWTNCWLMTLILFQASSKFTQFSEPIGTFSKIPCRNSECSRVWINWRRVVQRRKCSDSMTSF